MNNNKIIRVKTENSYELKTLLDVLKETLLEVNIAFVQDPDQAQDIKKIKEKEKKPVKKIEKKKKANLKSKDNDIDKLVKKDGSESVSESEDEEQEEEEIEEQSTEKEQLTEQTEEDKKKMRKNQGGIRIIASDEHQSLMIYVKLDSSNFVEYFVRYPKVNVGLDLRELYKFMKGIDKDSIMTISVDKDDEQKIEFHLQNPDKGIDTHYKQKMMEIDDISSRIPRETKFEIAVSMDTQDFRKICSEMSQFNEYMEIICTHKEITFKCLGDQNELVKTFKNGESGGVKITCIEGKKKPIVMQAIYSLKYLLTFGKCVNLCNDIQLYLKNDYPLFIHYTVGNLGKMFVALSPCDEKAIKERSDTCDKYK
jgi:proliferating cell nuclear antigen PCNA